MAEWVDATAPTGANRIAASKEAYDKAPANASRYESKLFNFPSGSLRTLTFKKGAPVFHQITFEREIYVLRGSATLTPLKGHPGKPVQVSAGDALFLPSGVLINPMPKEDFVLVLAMVGSTTKFPKASIVPRQGATETLNVQWQKDGKEFTADNPDDAKKAPADAARFTTRRYVFDGNSIRVATLQKGGGRTNTFNNNRVDVLIYMAKGRMRRKEGDQVFEIVAGDATREKMGNSGYWEILEDSVFIATDAPVNPGIFSPTEIDP
jgi:quercetin dioxygenase-like cupin family protein